MNRFLRTREFDLWLKVLRDPVGKARILARIRSAEEGNFGDCGPVGGGVWELREHICPGYRLYYGRRGKGLARASGSMIMRKVAAFDAADYLDDELGIAEYLNAALEDEKPDVFLRALSDVARARGMTSLARETGLGRESLYKALAPGARPRCDTIFKLMRSFGVELRLAPVSEGRPGRTA